jgi:hypothetical protein
LGCLLCAQAYAQHTTEFLFSETAPESIRKAMQTNAEAVFAEINRACEQNTALSLSPANVTDEASKRIHNLWAVSHFYCTKTSIKEMVLNLGSSNGYQVRNIPVFIEKEGNKPEDKYQDMVIEFNKDGKISDLTIAIHQITNMIEKSNAVTNERHKIMLRDFMENFRTAYNRKDMAFLRAVYSDDALIITGKVLKQDKPTDYSASTLTKEQIKYVVQGKEQYLNNLQRVFDANSYINVKFEFPDSCWVEHYEDENNPNRYGVRVVQDWNASGGYHDKGWLFLVIDYENEEKPLIWVRTWQPLTKKNPKTGKEEYIHYNDEDIFGVADFPF